MSRPVLNQNLSADDFQRWYWLKEELSEFCRVNNLSRVGSKPDLAQRVIAYLSGAELPPLIKVDKRG